MFPTIFAQPDAAPQPLTVTPPAGQGSVGGGSIADFLGTVDSLAGAAGTVGESWGEIRGLDDVQEASPQPTQKNIAGPAPDSGMGVAGITTTGILVAVAVAVGIYFLGGNMAWALVGGITAAVLSAWLMGG